jgi:hypothetical protein
MFPIGQQPDFIKDLNQIEIVPSEIAIQGSTKNLERLQKLNEVEKLWLFTVNQSEFDLIMNNVKPRILYIYELKVEDLSSLEKLTEIEEIHLCWNTKATQLWDLSKNARLKSLSIEDFKRLNNLEPLKHCQSLKELALSGGISNTLNINTLKPLEKLTGLKYLTMSNIRVKDESLEPLANLVNLKELNISNQFPTKEYARLSVRLPNTKCDKFQPYIYLSSPIGDKDVMVVGKRKPFLNSKADLKKLQKYEEQFKDFQARFRDKYN